MYSKICISINNLTKRYKGSDNESLKQISFNINRGEKFGILGPNGAGKTTLISILCGILSETSGEFNFYRDDLKLSEREIKSVIGYVPQEYAFYEDLSPWQNMMYFGSLYNLPEKEIKIRSEEIFSVLGLGNIANKKTKIFSGGMKRRMNMAIGIIHKPEVLFLDEPTVGADVQSKHAMMEYLEKLNAGGTTIIYSSHLMEEAEAFCERVAFIHKGELIACDNLKNMIEKNNTSNLKSLFLQLTGEGYYD